MKVIIISTAIVPSSCFCQDYNTKEKCIHLYEYENITACNIFHLPLKDETTRGILKCQACLICEEYTA